MTPDEARWLWHCINCKRLNECGAGKSLHDWDGEKCLKFEEVRHEQ